MSIVLGGEVIVVNVVTAVFLTIPSHSTCKNHTCCLRVTVANVVFAVCAVVIVLCVVFVTNGVVAKLGIFQLVVCQVLCHIACVSCLLL